MKKNINDEWSQEDFGTQTPEYPNKVSNRKSNSGSGARNSSASPNRSAVDNSQLMQLFENQLKDLYGAEQALTTAIPKMIKHAESKELIQALEDHLEETSNHVTRLDDVFEIIGKNPNAKKCEAMTGLIKEAEMLIGECQGGAMCDAAIISAAQKIENYEIATYGTLRQFAETLGLPDAAELLEETLEEEKAADRKLTEIAVAADGVNEASMHA